MTRSRSHPHPAVQLALATVITIACAKRASADDGVEGASEAGAAAPSAEGDATATATSEAVTSATATTTSTAVASGAPRYPRAVIARPLTLPSRVAMFGADAIGDHDLGAMSGAPIVGYGITDKLEVQALYAFAARKFEAKGSLAIDVGYAVLRGALDGKLEVVARVRGGYNVLDMAPTPWMVGAHVQYNVTDWLAIISGVPGTQQLRISLTNDADMGQPIDLGLPLGIGVQPTGQLYLQLDTKLAQLAIHDSDSTVIFRDATPLALTILYNLLDVLDLQAAIGTDLSNTPADAVTFLVGARLFAGQL